MDNRVDLTILIPLYNEEESLRELHSWITRVVTEMGVSYEVLFINDGSTDGSWQVIQELRERDPNVRGISFIRNYGKSPGLQVGFQHCRGNVVITMDADLQDSPDEIPELYRMIVEDGFDVVSGWKKKRYDPLNKTLPTKLFNATVRKFSGIKLHDFNCGLKSYRGDVVKNIEVYNDMHRFLPYMAKLAGFENIGEKSVQHQARKYGHTKFGMSRFVNGYLDLLVLWFTGKFSRKPMHFFGLWGSVMFIIGFLALMGILIYKFVALQKGIPARLVTDLPYFYICILAIILGVQLFLTGFIGELLARQSPNRNSYIIKDEI
ncbi:glycosyltransferase family 2 protein [Porphyromonas levii]|uniref:glycosyltransferase family 2 protein n=1 Tax=Porphyromonas levii TaxID=28114 RepID=UPI001D9F0E3C|nr:glycosyltransferase family 2 protein [Porphyromonas levii]MBR8713146.1 Dodecaprenyl-phosphate galacturonate synthase [Porphyromonas levii]MBR8714659.1 Dodecaprenyl-phosphate galacturonate synthase [Porphyromonas levii]MBR8727677.1 Dodecaprenyl-phosphate galacturonate synthase [Porphyromonas levii]MBR8729314.1 Dodecaprenyl-phosphate galacturonate synthase [Porphyromonas levii]MBR8731789.1 Dodecaprenyl-phosphate galacturonate synthase [Porphyromonas levii]